ncbi:hypothetical protein AAF712_002376 [Marasmius tenuissimus]|uniref:F-box domain-containing protein n=1 Tax=Marasmius tenuissimus TaxID=585030 RepID=A0ABR3AC19_9AGAR
MDTHTSTHSHDSTRLGVARLGSTRSASRPTSAYQGVQLPLDLLQNVVDELDETSLRQCALAARCFVLPARRKFFTKISLCEREPRSGVARQWHKMRAGLGRHTSITRIRQFAGLLETSPDLGMFTEELIVEGLELIADQTQRSWHDEQDAPLHAVIPRLSNLRSISLHFYQKSPLYFDRLPQSSSVALVNAVQSSKMQRIVLENVIFGAVDDCVHFLSHAASGGHLTELSIASFSTPQGTSMKGTNTGWKKITAPSLTPTDTTNVLNSFQIFGSCPHVEDLLQWARNESTPLQLNDLATLEIVTPSPMSSDILRHVVALVNEQSTSRLQHLGLTYEYSPGTTRSSNATVRSLLPQSFLSKARHTLRSITLYPISRVYDHNFFMPEEMVDWWCSLLRTSSFPNLTEFCIHRRGTYAPFHVVSRLPHENAWDEQNRFARNAAQWRRLERELEMAAPNATLQVEVRARAQGHSRSGVGLWRKQYFPDGDYRRLEMYFPLAHSNRVPLVVDLQVETVS